MCGIFAIVTKEEQALGPILIEAGHRLSYRGYDTVGAATIPQAGEIDLRKDAGKVQDVAEHLELNPKTVKAIDKCFLEKSFGQTDGHDLRILAIDEIALRKGHHYMTVVMDYCSGRIVWMGQNRDKETLDRFFAELTEHQKQCIKAVAIDMWEPFINRIKHHCPDAHIVFDFFHVVQAFGKVIDKVRRDEYVKATEQEKKNTSCRR